MAEALPNADENFDKELDHQQIETLILMREGLEISIQTPQSVPLKECTVLKKEESKDYVVKPHWPYGIWSNNCTIKMPILSNKALVDQSKNMHNQEINTESSPSTENEGEGESDSFLNNVVKALHSFSKVIRDEHGISALIQEELMKLDKKQLSQESSPTTEEMTEVRSSFVEENKTLKLADEQIKRDNIVKMNSVDIITNSNQQTISDSGRTLKEMQLDIMAKMFNLTNMLSMSLLKSNTSNPVDSTCKKDNEPTCSEVLQVDSNFTMTNDENTSKVKDSILTPSSDSDIVQSTHTDIGQSTHEDIVQSTHTDIVQSTHTDIVQSTHTDIVQSIQSDSNNSRQLTENNDSSGNGIECFDLSSIGIETGSGYPKHFNSDLDSPARKTSLLSVLVDEWKSAMILKDVAQIQYISHSVRKLIQDTVKDLSGSSFAFVGSEIIETGSMAESTRILKPDEFDFTITLPELVRDERADLVYNNGAIAIYLRPETFDELGLFLEQYPFVDTTYSKILTNAYLLRIFQYTIEKHLPTNWQLLEECKNHSIRVYLKNQTLTLHIRDPVYGLSTSVDICFAVSLSFDRIETIRVMDDFHAGNLKYLQEECQRQATEVVAVISKNALTCDRFFFLVDTKKFMGREAQRQCYMLAKYVARHYLPSIVKNSCSLCSESIIPSFYLKTTCLFMMDFYSDPDDWGPEQLPNRLIEIFDILQYSLQKCGGSLAYHNMQWGLKMDFKATYKPEIGSLDIGIGMPGTQKCTLPKLFFIGHKTSTTVENDLKKYWEFMENESWTVGELLERLGQLFRALKNNLFIL